MSDFARSATPQVGGALAAAGLGAVIAGPAGAVVGGVAGALIPEIADALEERRRRANELVNQMVSWAAEIAGMSPADLSVWVVHDDERLQLLTATVQAALSTLDRVKARTLSRVFAEAVEDDAKLDLSVLMTQALGDLEPPHVRVLRVMATEAAPIELEQSEPISSGAWLYSSLRERLPNLSSGILPLMATLEQHALVHAHGIRSVHPQTELAWSVTAFGTKVVAYLSESATDLEAYEGRASDVG